MAGWARQVAPWLLLFALLLRGMIPGGYMPNLDPDNGKGWLVICTGSGPASIALDGDGGDGGGGQAPVDTQHTGLCPFVAAVLLVPVLWLLALPVPRGGSAMVRWLGAGVHVWRLLCGPVLGARAPPMAAAA